MKHQLEQDKLISAQAASLCLDLLRDLKERVAANLSSEFTGILNPMAVRRVVNDADALAWSTPFPALFLPALAEEKAQLAVEWENRQQRIRALSMAFAE